MPNAKEVLYHSESRVQVPMGDGLVTRSFCSIDGEAWPCKRQGAPEPVLTITNIDRQKQTTLTVHRIGPEGCSACVVGYPKRHLLSPADLTFMLDNKQELPQADDHAQRCVGLVHAVNNGSMRYMSSFGFTEVCALCGFETERQFINGSVPNCPTCSGARDVWVNGAGAAFLRCKACGTKVGADEKEEAAV